MFRNYTYLIEKANIVGEWNSYLHTERLKIFNKRLGMIIFYFGR